MLWGGVIQKLTLCSWYDCDIMSRVHMTFQRMATQTHLSRKRLSIAMIARQRAVAIQVFHVMQLLSVSWHIAV